MTLLSDHMNPHPRPKSDYPDLECSVPGFVSCWIGAFESEAMLRWYLGEDDAIWKFDEYDPDTVREAQELSPFWKDLGISWINLGLLENCRQLFFRQAPAPVPISELVQGFPHASKYQDNLSVACSELGILTAATAICLYDIAYDRRGAFRHGSLNYVDAFRFR
jgi:hypothetical protein